MLSTLLCPSISSTILFQTKETLGLLNALDIEKAYDDNRIAGLMYCAYKTDDLLNSEIKGLIELFEMHDQIFILNEAEIYKLYLSKENIHKLLLN